MDKKKVIVAERISDKGVEKLKANPNLEVTVNFEIPREELLKIIGDYDALIVRSVTKVNEELYNAAKKLKVVGRAGNGVDNIDIDGATKRGIIVVNTPEANVISAAEHTIGLMLASCRNTVRANEMLEKGIWDRKNLKGIELYHKTLGIIGLGRIGALVAKRMHAFDMRVIAYDPYIPDSRFQRLGVEKCETLDDLLKQSDVITIHTPKTEETIDMLTAKEWAKCKRGVRVVNCARGGLYNEKDLAEAVKAGIVASVGLDVVVDEPKPISPLIGMPQCVVTPHLGASTFEAQDKVGLAIAEEVINVLDGKMVPNAVNLPAIAATELEDLRGYLRLGVTLGKLYYQLRKEPVEKVEVTYEGEAAQQETNLITRAVLQGLLKPVLRERVNMVNAELAAETRGITVTEGKVRGVGRMNKIQVTFTAGKKVFMAAGVVTPDNQPHITEIQGYRFDVVPAPYMIVARNDDKPGMIGQIGTLLGAGHVNIATMQVARKKEEGAAMMVLTVDSAVDKNTMDIVRNLDGIVGAKMVLL
ncbi:MAG: phosphoglycerate dehydrogenase [Acidaminococcus sp.]|jgi:D-3-phosphoglycerate dehydrogenase|nr:phosphoglycerate dehydrogenase [Acidaminococcus sp.]MCI2116752.1 phosphoglycerate dehydrogenase [Acidaminococcus sp.]